jgi:hypothetical protein
MEAATKSKCGAKGQLASLVELSKNNLELSEINLDCLISIRHFQGRLKWRSPRKTRFILCRRQQFALLGGDGTLGAYGDSRRLGGNGEPGTISVWPQL